VALARLLGVQSPRRASGFYVRVREIEPLTKLHKVSGTAFRVALVSLASLGIVRSARASPTFPLYLAPGD